MDFYMHRGVSAPNPRIVQGSTVYLYADISQIYSSFSPELQTNRSNLLFESCSVV